VGGSHIDDFLWIDTCDSSNQLNKPVGTITAYLHLEKPKLQVVFLSKTRPSLTANHILDALASNRNGFLLKCVFSTQLNRSI
jgi:hypothetical protein